jgi:hypothetical protein
LQYSQKDGLTVGEADRTAALRKMVTGATKDVLERVGERGGGAAATAIEGIINEAGARHERNATLASLDELPFPDEEAPRNEATAEAAVPAALDVVSKQLFDSYAAAAGKINSEKEAVKDFSARAAAVKDFSRNFDDSGFGSIGESVSSLRSEFRPDQMDTVVGFLGLVRRQETGEGAMKLKTGVDSVIAVAQAYDNETDLDTVLGALAEAIDLMPPGSTDQRVRNATQALQTLATDPEVKGDISKAVDKLRNQDQQDS